MSMKTIFAATFLFIAFIAVPATGLMAARQGIAPITPPAAQATGLTAQPPATELVQVDRWIAMSDQFNNRLLNVVYGSLAAIIAMLIALVGYNWFANNRSYERDKAALSSELNAELSKQISNLRASLSEQHDSQINSLSELAQSSAKTEAEKAAVKISAIKTEFEARLGTVTTELKGLYVATQDAESQRWADKGVFANAIMCQIEIGKTSVEIGHSWRVSQALERIEDFLAKKPTKGGWEPMLTEFLDKAPARYDSFKTRIRAKLATLA
jgi:hypothetical protein